MELTEPVADINQHLVDIFGIDTSTGQPIWRVVWSEDQFEKRRGTYDDFTPGGIYLRTVTEVREVPKYRQWIKKKFVLERLVLVPEVNMPELPSQKLSYEPIFVFQNGKQEYLPPDFEVCQLVIDTVYAAQGKESLAKYTDPEEGDLHGETRVKRIAQIQEELFGDESGLMGTTLDCGSSIIVPPKS